MVQDVVKLMEEEDSDRDGGDGIATKDSGDNKMSVSEIESVPVHYTPELGSMINISFSNKAHQVSVCEQGAHFWTKWWSNGDVLSHVNYKRHGNVFKRHTWSINDVDEIPWLSGPGRCIFHCVWEEWGEKSRLARLEQKIVGWMQDLVDRFCKPGEFLTICSLLCFRLRKRVWNFHCTVVSVL